MNYPDTKLLINGQWRDSSAGKKIDVLNPATGLVIGQVEHASISDLDDALLAAEQGFGIWRNTPAIERSNILRKAAKLLSERVDAIATILTQEQGKPLSESKAELAATIGVIEWMADEGLRVYGRVVPPRNLKLTQLVIKEPVGPIAAFTPWNFPINQIVRKLMAALTTGCSIIVKAPEETPASPAALIQAFLDAGVPHGVIGLVFGDPAEISKYLIAHPIIRKITFTGSTIVGKQLAALAGLHMKRATMELGGHAPVIICNDADITNAAKVLSGAKLRNAGQVCISPTRFLVQEGIAQEFIRTFTNHMESTTVGQGLEEGVQMGPLANIRRLEAMKILTKDAIDHGAELMTGGEQIVSEGNFFSPTVLNNVSLTAKIFNEEPFGPIAGIKTFSSLDSAIEEANRLPFGLASYAFTSSLKNTHELVNKLSVGMLWVNQPAIASPEMPFGGVKDSGYGSEGGPEALEAYLISKAVSILNV